MPPKRANPKSYERARALRHELTPAERKLWSVLRGGKLNGINFRRQLALGNDIVDFPLMGTMHLHQKEIDY